MAVRRDGANLGETEVRICNAITFPLRVIVLTPTRPNPRALDKILEPDSSQQL